MALPNSPGSPGAGETNPSVIDLGTIFVDSDIIFGFTSHLLRRKTKVRASSGSAPGTAPELPFHSASLFSNKFNPIFLLICPPHKKTA